MKCDFLIIGAGFAGSVIAERVASQLNASVIIVDKRMHIGGNAFDYRNEDGVLIHKYGPHIFHSATRKPVDYLSKFTDWNTYFHHTLGVVEGNLIPIPFNFNSLYKSFPKQFAKQLEQKLIASFGYGIKIPILKLKEHNDEEVRFLAEYIYKNIFLNYTKKQWDLTPEELDPSVTSRVPILLSRDNRYFQDNYQVLPKDGYTKIFERQLAHPNVKIFLNTTFKDIKDEIKYKYLIYTGAIDEFFDYQFGKLPYRSLRFDFQRLETQNYQPVAVVNYPNNNEYTRITEFKKFMNYAARNPLTTIAIEYPEPFEETKNERYYPIPQNQNIELYNKYFELTKEINNNIFLVGRLAEYKYYNMNEVVASALMLFENKISKLKI
jgi:UDP-galactopyranose mutase